MILASHRSVAGLVGGVRGPDAQSTESNENTTVVSVTPTVVEVFKEYGFAYIGHRTKEALAPLHAKRNVLLTGARLARLDAKVEAILSEPVFAEFRIHVHSPRRGSLARDHEKRFQAVNVAPEFALYRCGLEDGFYQHYRREFPRRLGTPDPCPPASERKP